MVLSKSVEIVPAKGGEVRVQLRSNVDYEVIVPEDVDWVEQLQSDKADELVFNVKPNSSDRNREAKITIKDKNSDLSQIFRIIQTSGGIVLDETYYEVPASGDTLDIVFTSYVEYEIIIGEDDASWITYEETESEVSYQHNLRIFIGPNTVNEIRTAEIDIKDKNSDLSQTITIKQIVGSIILEDSYFEVDAKGGSIEVNLSTDIDCEVIIPENIDWVTRIETKSLVKKTFYLNVLPNRLTEEREAKITVKDINSDVSQTLTIKQKVGKIIVEQNEFEVQFKGETISIPYSSDIECKVIIPESAQSWISVVETKSMESHSVQLSIALNEAKDERTATVAIQDVNSPISQDIKITQMAFGYYKGNIEATSEEDLKEICDAGYTIIDGNVSLNVKSLSLLDNLIEEIKGGLSLGKSVSSLDGLYGLKHIGGDFIERSDKLVSFEGLNNLKTIGGSFDTDGVSFNSLKSLESIGNDFTVSNVEDFTGLEHLTTIGGILYIEEVSSCEGLISIQSIQGINANKIGSFAGLNNLHSISGDLFVTNSYMSNFSGLNNLREIGGNFELYDDYGYTSSRGFVNLNNFEGLSQLQTINGDFIIRSTARGNTSFGALESFKGLENLNSINGNFFIYASAQGGGDSWGAYDASSLNALSSFEGLSKLNSIGGDFIIEARSYRSNNYHDEAWALSKMQSFSGMSSLTTIGGDFYIYDHGNTSRLTELSFSVGLEKLKTINGDFTIESEGIRPSWAVHPNIASLAAFNNLETIKGNLSISFIDSFSGLDNLKTILGDFVITSGDTQGISNLTTVGGNIAVSGETSSINGLTSLNAINGNLFISETSMSALSGISKLQKVGGNITISGNSKLEDISGLGSLANCANISITNSPNLYNFQPLETAAKNMTGTWYVYGCGYNPTKYQMLNGESKPQE